LEEILEGNAPHFRLSSSLVGLFRNCLTSPTFYWHHLKNADPRVLAGTFSVAFGIGKLILIVFQKRRASDGKLKSL